MAPKAKRAAAPKNAALNEEMQIQRSCITSYASWLVSPMTPTRRVRHKLVCRNFKVVEMEGIFHDVFACFFQFVWFIFNGCFFSPLGLHVFCMFLM